MSQSTICRCCQRLGEDVRKVLIALDVEQLKDLLGDLVSNHMVLHVNMFGSRVVDVVLRDAASSNVVQGSSDGKDDGDQFGEQVSEVHPFSSAACIGGRDVLRFS
jgi:uncharacterized membrane protein affecting hemolysin expression